MATLAQGLETAGTAPRANAGTATKAPPVAGQKGAPAAPKQPQGTAGHWVQTGGQWKLIHAVGPGQWVQGPKQGFKAPPKPISPNAGATAATAAKKAAPAPTTTAIPNNPLSVLTPQQVQAKATNTISSAYNPVYTELNMEGSQEQAIIDKQTSDNQYYEQWANAKMASVQSAQTQVDQSTSDLETQLVNSSNTALGGQQAALTNAANATPGTNNAPSFTAGQSALGTYLAAGELNASNAVQAGATRALTQEGVSQAELGETQDNSLNAFGANQAKEQATFTTAMQKIATTRATDVAKESSDLQKEVARLQGVNISVAENDRNYNTAAEKLGITAANTASEITSRSAATKLAGQKEQVAIAQNGFNDQIKAANLTLSQKKFAQSVIDDSAANALKAAQIYKDQHGGGLTLSEQNTQYSVIDKATGQINDLISQHGLTPQQAYQALLNGSYVGHGVNSKGAPVVKTFSVPRLQNQSLLNAAYNLRQGGGGLTAGDMNYLNQIGLTTAGTHYAGKVQPPPVAPAPTIKNGGAGSPRGKSNAGA